MSILANTYDSLDKSLDVGIEEFSNITTNKVYTFMNDIESGLFGSITGYMNKLSAMTGRIKNTAEKLLSLPGRIMNSIKSMIDNILNRILGSSIFGFAKDILGLLQSLDQNGLKGFLINELGLGNATLCNNLGTFQDLMDGIFVHDAVRDGLFLGLAIDWANRVCKPYTKGQESRANNRERLEMLNGGYKGIELTPNTIMSDFKGLMSGFYNSVPKLGRSSFSMGDKRLMNSIIEGDTDALDEVVGDLLTDTEKEILVRKTETVGKEKGKVTNSYALAIPSLADQRKVLVKPSTSEIARHIKAKDSFTKEDIMRARVHPYAKDALGSFVKNLLVFDLNTIPKHAYLDRDDFYLWHLEAIQKKARVSDFSSRRHTGGDFFTYDFDYLLDYIDKGTEEEFKDYPVDERVYSYNGLHPTTNLFINDNIPYQKVKSDVRAGG